MGGNSTDIGRMAPVDLMTLATEYAGRWVAIDPENGGVLASGASAKEVLDAAKAAGASIPLVMKVSINSNTFQRYSKQMKY